MDAPAHADRAINLALNPLALRVVRAILDGAHDFELMFEGRPLRFQVRRSDAVGWPDAGVEGLSPDRDGAWPAPVSVEGSWPGGRTAFLIEATYWRDRGRYAQLMCLRAYLPELRRELLWMTLPLALKGRTGGEAVITASFAPFKRVESEGERGSAATAEVRAVVERAKLPLHGLSKIEVCRVRLDDASLRPSAQQAFERIAALCVLKLPFFDQTGESIEGAAPFEVPRFARAESPSSAPPPGKKAGIWPLPGGVRQYKQTLDSILRELQQRPMARDEVHALLESRFGATGKASRDTYLGLLIALRVCERKGEQLALSETGAAYIAKADAAELFELIHAAYTGMLEVLVLAEALVLSGGEDTTNLLKSLLGVDWASANQVSFRRNWLLSLGLTDRTADGDVLTSLGKAVLARHQDEVRTIRERLDDLVDEVVEPSPAAPTEEPAPGLDDAREVARVEPPAWRADRVALLPRHIEATARGLELDASVMARACAALSAGKHLLLVGPPGTGKTELARAIVGAARAEGYCAGPFMATASADWTTFDTIGGYALQRDGSLRFRAGALLRAVEQWQWLVIDELNRADVDRAFGELMTVLAGQTSDTAYELSDGRQVRVGPDPTASHPLPQSFRVLATMNTWDKTSLFRLSHAVQRRFAILHVDVPSDPGYENLLHKKASEEGIDQPLDESAGRALIGLFLSRGLGAVRAIGPAIAIDVVRYTRCRLTAGGIAAPDAMAEALGMFVLPQLEGLDQDAGRRAYDAMLHALGPHFGANGRDELRQRFADVLPHVELSR